MPHCLILFFLLCAICLSSHARAGVPPEFNRGNVGATHFSQAGELVRATQGRYSITHGNLNYEVPMKLPTLPGGMRPDIRMSINSTYGSALDVFGLGGTTEKPSDVSICYVKNLRFRVGVHLADEASPRIDDSLSLMRLCYQGAVLESENGYRSIKNYWTRGRKYRSPLDPKLRVTLVSDKEIRVEKGNGDQYRYALDPKFPKNRGLRRDKYGVILSPDHTDNRPTWNWSLMEMRSVFGETITFDYTQKRTGGPTGPSVDATITYSNGYTIKIGSRVRGSNGRNSRTPELVVYYTAPWGASYLSRMYYAEYGSQDLSTDLQGQRQSYFKWRMKKVFECGFPRIEEDISKAICAKPLKPRFKKGRYVQLTYDHREARHRDFSQTLQYLESVEDGFGNKVTFEYAKDSDTSVFPKARHSNATGVVTRVSTNNGQAYRYHYDQPILGIDRSVYAFQFVTKVDESNYTYEKTEYDFKTGYNHLPLVKGTETGVTNKKGNWPRYKMDGALPNQVTTHHYKRHPEASWYVYQDKTVTKHYHIRYVFNGDPLKHNSSFSDTNSPDAIKSDFIGSTTVDREVDQYGTEAKVTTSITDNNGNALRTIVRQGDNISNDMTAWLIGFVGDEYITSTVYKEDGVSAADVKSTLRNFRAIPGTTEVKETSLYWFSASKSPQLIRLDVTERNSRGLVERTIANERLDINPRTTEYKNYDHHGFPRRITNALGHSTTMAYDERFGDVSSITDANGLTTTTKYNPFGEVVQQINARDVSTNIIDFYCHHAEVACPAGALYGQATTVTHPDSTGFGAPTTIVYYDRQGRNVGDDIITPSGDHNRVIKTYYTDGRIKTSSTRAVTDARRRYHRSYWYSDGKVWGEISPDGLKHRELHVIKNSSAGIPKRTTLRFTTSANEGARVRKTRFNLLDQIEAIDDPKGTNPAFNLNTQIDYSYDAHGNLATTTVNKNPSTTVRVEYNPLDQRILLDDPSAGKIAFTYTGFGELKTQTWAPDTANAKSMTYFYDGLGRKTKRIDLSAKGRSNEHVWLWDKGKKGLLDAVKTSVFFDVGGFEEKHSYNRYGERIKTKYYGNSHRFTANFNYSYDLFGREDITTYNDAILKTKKQYFGTGFPYKLVESGTSSRLIYQNSPESFNGESNLKLLGNGVVTSRRYDALGRLKDIESGRHSSNGSKLGKEVQDLNYAYNAYGNLKHRQSITPLRNSKETFTYDTFNRVKTASLAGYNYLATRYNKAAKHYYNYDKLGNLIYRSDKGIVNNNSNTAQNIWYGQFSNAGVHAVTHAFGVGSQRAGRMNYKYDAYGNVIDRGGKRIRYNIFNKPLFIDGMYFAYDANHQRFAQTVHGIDSIYLEGGRYRRETDKKGLETTTINVEGVYQFKQELSLVSGKKALKRRFLHVDHLGSVNAVTNEQGKVTSRAQYNVWGEQIVRKGSGFSALSTGLGFGGHETLENGLVHMGGRVYDSTVARFMSADLFVQAPLNSQSFNRYTYVFNNPLGYTDPSGYLATLACENVDTSSCNGVDLAHYTSCAENLISKCLNDVNQAEKDFEAEKKRQRDLAKIRQYLARARALQIELVNKLFGSLSAGMSDNDTVLQLAGSQLIINQLEKVLSVNRVSSGSSRGALGSPRRGKHSESGGGDSQEGVGSNEGDSTDSVLDQVKRDARKLGSKLKRKEYFGLIYQGQKDKIRSEVVEGRGSFVSDKKIRKAFSDARKNGAKRYLGEWHNHPPIDGNTRIPSPDDVFSANNIASQLRNGDEYRAFLIGPSGGIREWDTSTSDTETANDNLIDHGKLGK